MKKAAAVIIFSCCLFGAPVCAYAQTDAGPIATIDSSIIEKLSKLPNEAPKDITEAVSTAGAAIKAIKAKNWWLASAGVIWLIMFLMKMLGLFKRIGKRWAYITVALLSMAAMLASKFGAGISWEAAWAVMTSGPFMAFANDFFKRGVLAKEPTTKITTKG